MTNKLINKSTLLSIGGFCCGEQLEILEVNQVAFFNVFCHHVAMDRLQHMVGVDKLQRMVGMDKLHLMVAMDKL